MKIEHASSFTLKGRMANVPTCIQKYASTFRFEHSIGALSALLESLRAHEFKESCRVH